MADINQVITQGIGTPSGIPEFLLLGLQPAGGAYLLEFGSGSYSYTGQTVTLTADYQLTFNQGTYTYTGYDLSFPTGYTVSFGSGSYTYTGQDFALLADYQLAFAQGTYTYTGQNFAMVYSGDTTATPATRICTIATQTRTYTILATDDDGNRTYTIV